MPTQEIAHDLGSIALRQVLGQTAFVNTPKIESWMIGRLKIFPFTLSKPVNDQF